MLIAHLMDINYTLSNAEEAIVTGLPEGITASFSNGNISITGNTENLASLIIK